MVQPKQKHPETPIEGAPVQPTPLLLPSNVTKPGAESIQGVTMKLGADNTCLISYDDKLSSSLDGWLLPQDKKLWTMGVVDGETIVTAKATQQQTPFSVLYLSKRPCQGGVGIRISVRVRPSNDVRSGKSAFIKLKTWSLITIATVAQHLMFSFIL